MANLKYKILDLKLVSSSKYIIRLIILLINRAILSRLAKY
jgi:hypothetical protein